MLYNHMHKIMANIYLLFRARVEITFMFNMLIPHGQVQMEHSGHVIEVKVAHAGDPEVTIKRSEYLLMYMIVKLTAVACTII